jgi:hypothetical protein
MKLALWGVDAESLRLAEAAIAAGHEISWPPDLAGMEARTSRLDAPAMQRTDVWEELYDPAAAEAILVGADAADEIVRSRQVQELARMGRPMLLVFPLFRSVLSYFEIDMARSEGGAVVHHFNPLAAAAWLHEAADWTAGGNDRLGRVEQIICTRRLADRSRDTVLWHFARDVEMLDVAAGGLDRIGAHAGADADPAAYAGLSVQLLGKADTPVRWSVEPPDGEEGLELTLIGQRGRTAARFDATGRLTEPAGQPSLERDAIDRFVAAVEQGASGESTWLQALHAMELADSIEISLRRGRMVDVHQQQLTEHLAFKGTMAAAGCGMLMVVIPLVLAVAVVAGRFGVPVGRFVPHVLLGILALFLGLQVLPKLLYDPPPKD